MTGLLLQAAPYIAAVLGVIIAAFGLRKGGRDAERARAAEETLKRVQKGQDAGAGAKTSGKTAEELARDNDGAWQ